MTGRDISQFRGYIESALEYADGSHSFENIRDLVAEGRLQLWTGPNSVVVTEIVEYPNYRVLVFFLAGGGPNSLPELETMYPAIEAWGRAQGCDRAVLTGRRGWERTFIARQGWQPIQVVYEKRLTDG